MGKITAISSNVRDSLKEYFEKKAVHLIGGSIFVEEQTERKHMLLTLDLAGKATTSDSLAMIREIKFHIPEVRNYEVSITY